MPAQRLQCSECRAPAQVEIFTTYHERPETHLAFTCEACAELVRERAERAERTLKLSDAQEVVAYHF